MTKKTYVSPKISIVGGVSDVTQAMMMGSFPDAMGRQMVMQGMMGTNGIS